MKIEIGMELQVKKENRDFGDCKGVVIKKIGNKFLIQVVDPLGNDFFDLFTEQKIERDFTTL
jgi:hypothetical protein